MNKLLLFFVIVIVAFVGCSESDDEVEIQFIKEMGMGTSVEGSFVSDAHTTTGKATINKEGTKLSFTNFKTDDGPKLLVYLSTDKNSTDFVNLGDLKGIEGDFEYDVPSKTDLDKYDVVSIWCVDFSVSFGHADLN